MHDTILYSVVLHEHKSTLQLRFHWRELHRETEWMYMCRTLRGDMLFQNRGDNRGICGCVHRLTSSTYTTTGSCALRGSILFVSSGME
eukprot:12121-Heterococcus_DN1.PRE.2